MIKGNLLYFFYLTLFTTPYLLADTLLTKQKGFSNDLALSSESESYLTPISRSRNTFLRDFSFDRNWSMYNSDEYLLKINSVSESIEDIRFKPLEKDSKTDSQKKLNWTLHKSDYFVPKDIKWLPTDPKSLPLLELNTRKTFSQYKNFDFTLLNIGSAVPTPETLSSGEIRFNIGQISPASSGYEKGTGNQNYFGEIDYGAQDYFLFSIFYSDADDPLTKRIVKLNTQPENRWSSYGGSFKWKFLDNSQFKIAIEGSLENWLVQSGGCAGSNCSFNTSNIFNSEESMVENNNLVGSLTLPIGFNYSSNLDFIISPKLTFLPESQSNEYGKGDFYGNNYGIGFGMAYKFIDRLRTFTSYYIPIGDSTNSFDEQLNFDKTSIYTLGLNYSIDSRTNLQATLSNGFGLSPATSILSIPSSDELSYGFNILYTPTKIDNYYYLTEENSSNHKFFNGLSVSNNSFLYSGDSKLNILYDLNGSWNSRYEKALSQNFIIDIIIGEIDKDAKTDSDFKSYFSPGNTMLRGGAKAILYKNKNKNGNLITSSLRGSFGRVLAESKPGYFFGESINSYEFYEKVSFNLNPKIGVSGSGESIGLGTGLHWKVLQKITLISETNIPIDNAENNMTFAIRYSIDDSDRYIDLYTSNAFSFIDMGQLMKRNKNILGVNLGFVF